MKGFTFSKVKAALVAGVVAFCATNAMAMKCKGSVQIQKPESWASMFINVNGATTELKSKDFDNGWYTFNVDGYGDQYAEYFFFMELNGGWNDGGITTKHFGARGGAGGWDQADKFSCDDFNGKDQLFIYDNPAKPGQTVVSNDPPNAKYFYLLVPNNADWKSAAPVLSLDGGKTYEEMTPDPERCGWFFTVFFNREPTDEVLILRDDVIGVEGALEDPEKTLGLTGSWGDDVVIIPLAHMFDSAGTKSLYFVADDELMEDTEGDIEGWDSKDPGVESDCWYELAAIIYDTDASLHGAFTCAPTWYNGCSDSYQRGNGCPTSAPFSYPKGGEVPCIGITPGIVKDVLGDNNKPVYRESSGCFTSKDAFDAMFTSNTKYNETYCVDLRFSRSADGKWEFDSDNHQSPGAKVPGGFYPAEEKPAKDKMMSERVPEAETKRKAEGPIFVVRELQAINKKEGVPEIDILCNGPGWEGGVDCSGKFAAGGDLEPPLNGVDFTGDGWGWSAPQHAPYGWTFYKANTETSVGKKTEKMGPDGKPEGEPRWVSGSADAKDDAKTYTDKGRNQHFCFESHATFTHKKGLRFSFRGDDDIWVFIGGRLAVDLGGTHLAAPGYVDLDIIKDKKGNKLEVGQSYPIDIFFCDRRTTMSNVRIKTNMYIKQSTGLNVAPKEDDKGKPVVDGAGNVSYNICYEESGGGSCAAAMGGADGVKTICGKDLKDIGGVSYYITNRRGDSTIKVLDGAQVYYGGINLTNRYDPVINTGAISGLGIGSYKLVIEVNGRKTYISFRVKAEKLDVVDHDVTYMAGDDSVSTYYKKGDKWTFVGKALAGGARVPIYITAVAGDEVDLISAAGKGYTLTKPAGVKIYLNETGDEEYDGKRREVDASGIDTLWVTLALSDVEKSPEKRSFNAGGDKSADIQFYAPELKFGRDVVVGEDGKVTFTEVTGDPDKDAEGNEYFNWMGSDVEVSLLIWDPVSKSVCSTCDDIKVAQLDGSEAVSAKVGTFSNGIASVTVTSDKVYYPEKAMFSLYATDCDIITAEYGNMLFREPPCPYPTVVELYDVRGSKVKNALRIPGPQLHSEDREYLDGIADSIVVTYHRPFGKNEAGVVPDDSLPNFICVNWEEDSYFDLEKFSLNPSLPYSTSASNYKYMIKDSIVTCSDTIMFGTIKAAFKASKDGQTLSFGGRALSKDVKTADDGTVVKKLRSWATYEDKGKLTVADFNKKVTDKIPPVIVKARISVNSISDKYDDIRITFSEPVKAAKEGADLQKALSYYVFSAGTIDPAKYPYDMARYITCNSTNAIVEKSDTTMLTYLHKDGDKMLPTPQKGDYVRFAVGVLTDTSGNAPLDYTAPVPSPWYTITGDTRSYIIDNSFASLDPNNEEVKNRMENKIITVPGFVDAGHANKDSVMAMFPNTVGQIVMSDMADLFEKYKAEYPELTEDDVTLEYEVYYFTNLGSFVAKDSKSIRCSDESVYGKGETCVSNPGFIYVGWTGVSNDGRLVGSGAYVSKFTSAVVLAGHKEGKEDQTQTYGFRRVSGKK